MKKYRLKKDLPTFKAGDSFTLTDRGDLYRDIGEPIPICVYTKADLDKFPNVLKDWFEEIPEHPKTVWDLKEGDNYYVLDYDGNIMDFTWYGHDTDKRIREYGNAFLTKEEAEKGLSRRKAYQVLLRDTDGFKPDWSESDNKYHVHYSFISYSLETNIDYRHNYGAIYFATEEDAENSIRNHRKEWLIYLGVEEECERNL